MLIAIDIKITIIADLFAFLLMLLLVCQSCIGLPSCGCVISHVCSLSDERPRQNALNSKNGVVGSNGKKIPITPRIRDAKPMIM